MKNIIIFITLISFCSAISIKGSKPLYNGPNKMSTKDTYTYLNPIYTILDELRQSLNIKDFVQVPTEKEIEHYKKLNPNSEIKPIEKDFEFETNLRRYRDMPDNFFLRQKLPSFSFSVFKELYKRNPKELAKRTVELWVKIHEAYDKSNLRSK